MRPIILAAVSAAIGAIACAFALAAPVGSLRFWASVVVIVLAWRSCEWFFQEID